MLAQSRLRLLRLRLRAVAAAGSRTSMAAPPSGALLRRDVAAMFLHDAVADAESQPRAFADALGGVEGIEDALGIFDSGAIVGELRANVAVLRCDANLQLAAAPGFENRIHRIVDDVQEYLLDLVRIGNRPTPARTERRVRRVMLLILRS